MLTYHCSNKTKAIEIADIGRGEGGQKLENLADIICERSLIGPTSAISKYAFQMHFRCVSKILKRFDAKLETFQMRFVFTGIALLLELHFLKYFQ